MMNKCVELKHAYEKCQHDEFDLKSDSDCIDMKRDTGSSKSRKL